MLYSFFITLILQILKENDDIRVQQMQEMAYLQSLENPDAVPPFPPQMGPIAITQIPVTVQPVIRGRARPVLRGAHAGIARGLRGARGGKPMAGLSFLFSYVLTSFQINIL